jgi:hypothetical protein
MHETETVVVFRRWNVPNHGVIALFPEEPADPIGRYCASFEHIGQHSSASYSGVVEASRATSPDKDQECAALKAELESRGYRLAIRKRHNGGYAVRRQKLVAYAALVAQES